MHSHPELTAFAAGKATFRRRIPLLCTQCAQAETRMGQPLMWLDQTFARWWRLSPFLRFAAMPLGFLLKRSVAPRTRVLGTLPGWGPLVLGAVGSLTGARDRSDHD